MAIAMVGGAGGKTAPARNHHRRSLARLTAIEACDPRAGIRADRVSLDAASFATAFADRRALELAGQGAFPL
jgi:hypothetical protein